MGVESTERLPRLDSLDLLRGIAILGIFLMNTQDMSMPVLAYYNPTTYDPAFYSNPGTYQGLSALQYAVWNVIHVFADLKFITVFSMMFGAGILLQGERLLARGISPAAVHYRRMAVLLVIGLLHAHVFWYGDVLAEYAMCGMLLFPLRKLPVPILIAAGLSFISVATLYHWADSQNLNIGVVHWLHNGTARLTGSVTGNEFEFAAYTGSWRQQMTTRFWVAFDNQTFSFLDWTLWRCGGSMLLGMALLRLRFFHGDWPRRLYIGIALIGVPLGWTISELGVLHNAAHGWFAGEYPDFAGMEYNYWGSLPAALGYTAVGTYWAVLIAGPGARLLKKIAVPIRAVGRTALSNYILQSVIGTTIFYGHGFGYFGLLSRAQLLVVVFVVWTFQLIVATLWTRRFRQGPLEGIWHRMVYGLMPVQERGI
jgi:uncharacterized protein